MASDVAGGDPVYCRPQPITLTGYKPAMLLSPLSLFQQDNFIWFSGVSHVECRRQSRRADHFAPDIAFFCFESRVWFGYSKSGGFFFACTVSPCAVIWGKANFELAFFFFFRSGCFQLDDKPSVADTSGGFGVLPVSPPPQL